MTGVAYYWDLNFSVVRHLVVLAVLIRSHSNLKACRHSLEFISSAHIAVLQARSHGVNIEEGVFSVLDVCARCTV